jgi:hypothetical protein
MTEILWCCPVKAGLGGLVSDSNGVWRGGLTELLDGALLSKLWLGGDHSTCSSWR